MEALFSGTYPDTMINNITDVRLPKFTEEESKLLKGSYDFFGLNYYVSQYATTAPVINVVSSLTDSMVLEQPDDLDGIPIGVKSGLDWIYSPESAIGDLGLPFSLRMAGSAKFEFGA
nr:beta-glucosidase 24-like [Tanacetum cinerariifolium]